MGPGGVSPSHYGFGMENVRSIEWSILVALATRSSGSRSRAGSDGTLPPATAGRCLERLQRLEHVLDAGDLRVDVLAAAHQRLQLPLALRDDALGLGTRLPLDPLRVA